MAKSHGKGTIGLSLRGKHRGERLKKRIEVWKASKMSDHADAYHCPGSNKK